MNNYLTKHPKTKIFLFMLSCIGVYGGAVNYGGFNFIPAIPFCAFVIYASLKWRRFFLATTLILFVSCATLYILKKQHGPLFHPALGQEFSFKQDMCLQKFTEGSVLATPFTDKLPCVNDGSLGGLESVQILPANTRLKISRISVSNADMGERYVIHAHTPLGELYYSQNLAVWINEQTITQSDLRRAIFYGPSLLMYWPMVPIFLMNLRQ